MNFNFYETSLNIQSGGAHPTNDKIFNCLLYKLTLFSTDFDQICVKIHCLENSLL